MVGTQRGAGAAVRLWPDAQRPRFRHDCGSAIRALSRRLPGYARTRAQRLSRCAGGLRLQGALAYLASLIARLDVEALDWLGTAMGGLVGMIMAAQPGNPVRRPVLNVVGPLLPKPAVVRLGSYVGLDLSFPSL